MAKKKYTPEEYERQHLRNQYARAQAIMKMYEDAMAEASRIVASGVVDPDKAFYFDDYPSIKKRIDELMNEVNNQLLNTIESGNQEEWDLSALKNDAMVDSLVASTGIPQSTIAQWKQPNLSALTAFQQRKIEGMKLSQRVWNLTDQFRQELELALDLGIGEGKSADRMSRDVRRYLRNPDKLFRRVRDKHGNLRLSKAAKAYHPGRGVYRSSYRNALRLTATENNMAYRTADHLRWQQQPFVVGIEIKLSNNHTCKGVIGRFVDICDDLAGVYPKDFKFVGWHPHCRCYCVPKQASKEEFMEYQQRLLNGEDVSNYHFKGEVKGVPDNFNKWIDKNKERAKGWSNMPYFVRHNPHYVKGFEVDTYSAEERKFTRARKTKFAMEESLGIFLQKKYPNIPNTEKAAIFYYTQKEGSRFRQLNKQLRNGNLTEFNEAFSKLLSKGISNLPKFENNVYRTIRLNKTVLKNWVELAINKDKIIFKGFTSTSKSEKIAKSLTSRGHIKNNETDVLIVIKSKNGRVIGDLSQFSGRYGLSNQLEVLFDKNSKFKFDGMTYKDKQPVFYLIED